MFAFARASRGVAATLIFVWCIWGAATWSRVAGAAALQADDFASDLEGWSTGGSILSRVASGGPDGAGDAFLRVQPAIGNLAAFNSGADWIGDYLTVGAEQVTVDLMAAAGTSELSIRLAIFGPGPGLPGPSTPLWTSTVAAVVPGDGFWRPVTFSLAPADLTRVRGNVSYNQSMSGVVRIMFRHQTGPPASFATTPPSDANLGLDNVALVGAAETPGDFDGDGDVDGFDFQAWQRGESPLPGSAEDLGAWQQNYGTTTVVAAAVPEPASLLVLLVLTPFRPALFRAVRQSCP